MGTKAKLCLPRRQPVQALLISTTFMSYAIYSNFHLRKQNSKSRPRIYYSTRSLDRKAFQRNTNNPTQVPAFRRPTRATNPALIGATDLPEPHYTEMNRQHSTSETNQRGNSTEQDNYRSYPQFYPCFEDIYFPKVLSQDLTKKSKGVG